MKENWLRYYSINYNFFLNGIVILMVKISFKDGAVVELHENGTFDIVEISRTDVEFNYFASVSGKEKELFNAVNNRLDGVLTP